LGRPFHDGQLRDLILAQSDAVGRSTPTILDENPGADLSGNQQLRQIITMSNRF
jgi:hypothetical protein